MERAPLTNPDKVLWPDDGITKADLFEYFASVADRLLPELEGRPITLRHHPRGVREHGFMRKNVPDSVPSSVGRWSTWASTAQRMVSYAMIENVDALHWCAGQNVTEFHAALFRIDRPDRIDRLVIDLDPSERSTSAASAAVTVREVLTELDLSAGVKTSGGRGLHVVVPIERRYDTVALRRFVQTIADEAVRRRPGDLTTEFRKDRRGDRLFVDCTRVAVGATLISAWSPRARAVPTVSTPLRWTEVDDGLDVEQFTHAAARMRPAGFLPEAQRLESAFERVSAFRS